VPIADTLGALNDLVRAGKARELADQRGRMLLELAMSCLARQPQVASITAGATAPEQANVAAVNWTMTPEELTAIDRFVPLESA